ncbi:MAG: response regulator [Candidatus Sumerlaeia bacterium]
MAEITGKPLAYIVDDDPDIRQIVRLGLMFEGWESREAGDGQAALALIRERTPDLLIIDLMMPGMSGMELIRSAISHDVGDLPVLMISAVREGASLVDDFRALPLPRKEFLHKPFNNDDLLNLVKRLVPGDFRAVAAPPAAPPVTPIQPPKTATPTNHIRGYRMLVVDDEPDICLVMKTSLGIYHNVRTAANGIEGLEALDEFEPDFVLTDVNMPLMNGLAFAESIRRHPRLGMTPIFFFTGESDASLPRKSYDVGGNLFLRKPIDVEQLLKFIDHFIQETGLKPGDRPAPKPQPKPAPAAPSKSAAPAAAAPQKPNVVRVLVVSQSPEDKLLIAPVLSRLPAVEALWTDDPYVAIGNLTRWDPDLVLYNVRHPRMDGIEFGQTLTLKRVDQRPLICFIGTSFLPLEVDYSRRNFAHEPIAVKASERLQGRLAELVDAARPRIRPKRMRVAEITHEEAERLRAMQDENDRKRREKEALRGRYDQLQNFIDSHFK